MIHLVLVKKDLLCYVQDVKAVRGMGRGLSDHHVIMCKVRLEETCIRGERWGMEIPELKVRK